MIMVSTACMMVKPFGFPATYPVCVERKSSTDQTGTKFLTTLYIPTPLSHTSHIPLYSSIPIHTSVHPFFHAHRFLSILYPNSFLFHPMLIHTLVHSFVPSQSKGGLNICDFLAYFDLQYFLNPIKAKLLFYITIYQSSHGK